jgi:CubicO group peptidase (beta-lactamase class C family)
MRFVHVAATAIVAFAPSSTPAQTKSQLDSTIPALMRAGEIPGLSVAVVRDGDLFWSGAFGVRNTTTQERVDRNTIFDAASLTKPVFAYAVLRLVDRGMIGLDKPIADVLTNMRMQHDARYLRITPRHVLSHSTGLPNWGGDRLDLAFDPGTNWGYSGEGFVWLSRAVERLTGLPTNELLRREVFEPLGMRHSSLTWNDSLEANGAAPHSEFGRARPRQRPSPDSLGNSNAAASLRTTAEDFAKFLIAVMDGQGLKRETARAIFAVQNEAVNAQNYRNRPAELRERIAWGLGWGLERRGGGIMAWHWGDNGDAKSFVVVEPLGKSAVVYFANGQTGLSIATRLTTMVFPGDQGALAWLRYEQHDVPARLVRRAILRAGLDSGAPAAARRYEAERARAKAVLTPEVARAVADALGAQRVVAAADTVLSLSLRDFPDSVATAIARGDLHLLASDTRTAATHYERATAMAPSDSVGRMRLDWTRQVITAVANPFTLGADVARRFVGVYGPRSVTSEQGRLYYQRTGGRKFALIPMAHDTFTLEGNPAFRLRFVLDAAGPASKIIGIYHDGRRDENARAP